MTRRFTMGFESEEPNFFDDTAGADTSADTGAGSAGAAPVAADTQPDNKAADLTDLNVQQLQESETAKLDGELKQMFDESRSVHKTAQDIEVINAALEAYKSEYRSGKVGRIRTAYLAMKTTVDPIIYSHQLTPLPAISMESEVVEYYQVSVESIGTLINDLIDRVLKFFAKVIDWVKRTYANIANSTAILSAANDSAHNTFKKWRALNGDKVLDLVKQKNLQDAFCELPAYKRYLTNLGRQPGSKDTHHLANAHHAEYQPSVIVRSYASGFIDYKFIGEFILDVLKCFDKSKLAHYNAAVAELLKGQLPGPVQGGFNPITDLKFRDGKAIDYGYTVGADGNRVRNTHANSDHSGVLNGYLGDLICESSYNPISSTWAGMYDGYMNLLYSWEFKLFTDPDAGVVDSSMAYLNTQDGLEGFAAMSELLRDLGNFRKSKDALEAITMGFRAMIEDMRNSKRFTVDADYATSSAEEISNCMVLTVHTLNKVIANLASTFTPWTSGARNLSVAWYYYIKATLEREKELLAAK